MASRRPRGGRLQYGSRCPFVLLPPIGDVCGLLPMVSSCGLWLSREPYIAKHIAGGIRRLDLQSRSVDANGSRALILTCPNFLRTLHATLTTAPFECIPTPESQSRGPHPHLSRSFRTLSLVPSPFCLSLQHTLNGWPGGSPTDTSHTPSRIPEHGSGRCGSLRLHRNGLAPSTPCRSLGAPTVMPSPSDRRKLRATAHRQVGTRHTSSFTP
jgi:hypothetical protein